MAEAPGHLLGQIIGNVLEDSVEPILESIAKRHGLYLDKKGHRAARAGVKLTWTDGLCNAHDLDFVLERAGSDSERGTPAAFIETAWRRYTKHSRAKAQEIQGALLPLLLHHSDVKPFPGAVVAGNWTQGALTQMRSSGFAVLHVSYEDVVSAFAAAGIDIDTKEETPDSLLQQQVDAYRQLSGSQRAALAQGLVGSASDEYKQFEAALEQALTRRVVRVVVLPLSGSAMEFATVEEAVEAVLGFSPTPSNSQRFVRFEVQLTYSNGDTIDAAFQERDDAAQFIRSFA